MSGFLFLHNYAIYNGRGGGIRTPNTRIWKTLYTINKSIAYKKGKFRFGRMGA
ncbi:hypothetical protein VQ7734_04899 [Vibrio quintilis]|uniref:Uncharacterized protein n=1 Tax=Vibrio quintilis TaxID=1117707 RepID=A0A1M7Z2T0_9VIBR|nr:hypothetical protein VQ7734_04899 [Vibrio quintilis]